MRRVLDKLPPELRRDPDVVALEEIARDAAVTIVHLIHRRKHYESQSKDYEFSRLSALEHWKAGAADVRRTLRNRAWRGRGTPEPGAVRVFDLARDATD